MSDNPPPEMPPYDPKHRAAVQLRELTQPPRETVPRPEVEELHFPPELRTAAITPRWSIVWTLTQDRLSSHSFYVALYARQIARIIGWTWDEAGLMFAALTHDLEETITGDITGPAKSSIVDRNRMNDYVRTQMGLRMPLIQHEVDKLRKHGQWWTDIQQIVSAADKLDALLFMIVERRLGNGVVEQLIAKSEQSLREAWRHLPLRPYDARTLQELYDRHVAPSIRAHGSAGGFGV